METIYLSLNAQVATGTLFMKSPVHEPNLNNEKNVSTAIYINSSQKETASIYKSIKTTFPQINQKTWF